jgi:pimeloyl-ACP methyl ester carboxylesterase
VDGDKPLTVVLLPALFLGNWMWEEVDHRLRDAGWPVIQFMESISVVDQHTARSINRIAARLKEVCRRHTDKPLVVAGDSLGGLIAFEFARSFPEETAGLVVSGAPGLNLKITTFTRELAEKSRTPQEFADAFMAKLLYDPSRHNIDQERYEAVVRELSEAKHLVSMGSALRAISRYNSRKIVMEIDTPKLFLWGRQDLITPPEDWERALPKMKNARMVVFDECGHGPMFEKPEEFTAETLAFLDELAGAQSAALRARAEPA